MKMKKTIYCLIFLICFYSYSQDKKYDFQFQNPSLSFEQRVDDLVSRLTLEEKVSQMLNSSPEIARLGIPAYDWWNETLHGVARTPFKTTVYPQAIGMAATFDKNSLFTMADYSALEGRAIYNKAVELKRTNERYLGLTYWTPNINIFRDPRWGRGQETYGEDPYLTAVLGDAFVKGLQGDDPKYLKAAACAKHYAVHSGPESLRHTFDVDVTPYELWDTYLPAFRKLITESNVAGVMCAYNAFRTQPCCASDILMNDILRKEWKFDGYVTSDCWAIDDFFKNHKTHPDAESAAADAVFHGTDIDCGTDAYKALVQAVKNGKISEKQIDISVKRLFMIRFRLGMFDPVSMVKYAQTPSSVLESKEHQLHALKMARQSIVLLKNEKNILPLNKNLKKIVVLGPNADNAISILGNYNGTPSKLTTVLQGIKEKVSPDTEVIYEKAVNFTNDTLLVYKDLKNQYSYEGKQGFKAEYYNNTTLSGQPEAVRSESEINNFWQEGEVVIQNIKANHFSARYTTNFTADQDGSVTFELKADDGYRFIINGKEVVNAWQKNRWGEKTFKLETKKNTVYKIVLEYWQGEGKAEVSLQTGNFVKTNFADLIEHHKNADAFIFAGGISPQLEGEEMPVDFPGFKGGDRTSILFPEVQTKLLKALQSSGKPVVFAMMTGSAIAIPWEAENIPAILNIWYGGQSAGTAAADVIFGDYNPAGRLPVTFYKNDSDLPSFVDYKMDNKTYRYFKGTPLYGFGYGLSYTSFKYSDLKTPVKIKKGQSVSILVKVANTGKTEGEEVAQLYLINQDTAIKTPLKSLKGFERFNLKPGENKTITFNLSPEDLSYVTPEGSLKQYEGKIKISIGGSQPDEKLLTKSNVVSKIMQLEN
ncbi:glycoside hydrolase family 3 protein [Flavobacterium johnsoniae]|uniref:Candidate beta-xylosidase Glycoside hydrolase family 3 n=1 Tax=Flavobacterium johnsoniae (strain ATCC 17061 / DSM 2064 / JCM 8514 / BCRC 14874 / CCUG 350202 / NBRC 14942 / NCIMB 11054 / UW101) TaxID=376686 RepID=A5FD26_FLAJ1|nr:glycoside hydrolase family 3 protein [Flavobacterium johnsoniae]ABQ06894.1 Candidate beta-xylosidase; Glycoside hydrolase family 3 [Flavobacterium johnsoniae UW101]OXE97248.1 glycosyl hydrolase [Flavobacterium johnsoniae UW101]WQG81273.1 glycoside hydrolase family 3 C-terminal domain-containing protein [Flavobacterium johnsoniae UW101]SHL37435.1 beta-glucosidase [Flavobacterium johnsoniae]